MLYLPLCGGKEQGPLTMDKIGILWDLDGTIVDSADLYFAPYARVFEKYGLGELKCTIEEYRSGYFGSAPEVFFRAHIGALVSDEQMAAMKWDYLQFADEYLRTSEKGGVSLIPGVDRVIDAFYAKGYPMAIASTSWMPTVVHTLEKVGLLNRFANIASGYLLPSKPAPDVFRLAAELNGMPCGRCVVFEDSLAGMKGAKNAGMKCVGIGTSVPLSAMCDADIALGGYDALRIEAVESLFSE